MDPIHRFVIMALIALLALTACAAPPAAAPAAPPAGPTPPPAEPSPTPATVVTLRVQGQGGGSGEVLPPLGQRFEQTHPEIKLAYQDWNWKAPEFAADLQAGRVPDVIAVPATEGDLVIGKGYIADLTDRLAEYPVSRDFNPAVMGPFTRNGRTYAAPINLYVMALFYDKSLFRKAGLVDAAGEPAPPETWEEFAAAAKAIKEKTGVPGFCILTLYNQGGWNFTNWGWQAGAEFERQEGDKWKAAFDEPAAVQALQFIKDLRWKYDVLQPNVELDANAMFPMIGKNQCGMAFVVPDWFGNILAAPDATLNAKDIGLTVLPAGPAGRAAVLGAGYQVINAKASPEIRARRDGVDHVGELRSRGARSQPRAARQRRALGLHDAWPDVQAEQPHGAAGACPPQQVPRLPLL